MTSRNDSLTLLYRGSLAACNYACDYCPFAKTEATEIMLETDRRELARFVEHIENDPWRNWLLMFIPWGEALAHEYYQRAIARLSRCSSVRTVAAQTNLSDVPSWLDECDCRKIALWCSFHPTQTRVDSFLRRLEIVEKHAVQYSVGVVGRDDLFDDAMRFRKMLPRHVTMWVNPFDDNMEIDSSDLLKWSQIDPMFSLTARKRLTRGTKCRCGDSVLAVSGNGDLRRCPFTRETLGSLYSGPLLRDVSPCPNERCDCFIGYIHWESDSFRDRYAEPALIRIAESPIIERYSSMINDSYRTVMIIFLVAGIVCSYGCSIKEEPVLSQMVQAEALTNHVVEVKSYELPKGNFRGVFWPLNERRTFEIWIISGRRDVYYYIQAPHEFIDKTTDVTDKWIIEESVLPENKMTYLLKKNESKSIRLYMPLKKHHYSFSILENNYGDEIVLFMSLSDYVEDRENNGIFGYVLMHKNEDSESLP